MPLPLTTPRLLLDELTQADQQAYIAYREHPDIARWDWPTTGANPDYRFVPHHSDKKSDLAIRSLDGLALCGNITFDSTDRGDGGFEIDYIVEPSSQGRGLATEAASRLIEYLFLELGAAHVTAFVLDDNHASKRVVVKLGMQQHGGAEMSGEDDREYSYGNFVVTASEFFARRGPLNLGHSAGPSATGTRSSF